jgi:hypothetical protein
MKNVSLVFYAKGHRNIIATHKTTFEFTKEQSLSKRGNCIVGVKSTKSGVDFPIGFKKTAKNQEAKITIIIEINNLKEKIIAFGDPQLQFSHQTDLVVRKSNFVCNRTLAVRADKSSADFSREIIEKLKDPNQNIKIILKVEN